MEKYLWLLVVPIKFDKLMDLMMTFTVLLVLLLKRDHIFW